MADVIRDPASDPVRPAEESTQGEASTIAQGGSQEIDADTLERKIAELEVKAKTTTKGKTKKKVKVDQQEVLNIIQDASKTADEQATAIVALFQQQSKEGSEANKELAATKSKLELVTKEKTLVVEEVTRLNSVCSKLETLCRELQKQNKLIQDESRKTALDEQQKRQELSTRFQDTVAEINTRMQQQGEERAKSIAENDSLRDRLISFAEKLEAQEALHVHEVKERDLEKSILMNTVQQQEASTQEAHLKMEAYAQQALLLGNTESELRAQLATYQDKFEQFQEMLSKSHEVFGTFKTDMDKMSKTVKKLEKENLNLRKQKEQSDVNMIQMLDERSITQKKFETVQAQKEKLEKLCRTLQAERKLKPSNADASEDTCKADDGSESTGSTAPGSDDSGMSGREVCAAELASESTAREDGHRDRELIAGTSD